MPARPEPKPCGTNAAYQRHIRNGEDPCEACHAASREYRREYDRKRYGIRERPKVKCGTNSGHTVHYNKGEKPCDACRAARSKYERDRRATLKAKREAAA